VPNRIRWVFYAICIAGLAIYAWAANIQFDVAVVSPDAPTREISYPVRIDDAVADDSHQLNFIVERYAPGTTIRGIDDADRVHDLLSVKRFSIAHRLITVICGLFFWLVSFLVFAPRTGREVVRDFFWASFLYGLAIMVGLIFFPAEPRALNSIHPLLRIFSTALIPPFFVRLGLRFPRERPILARVRYLTPLLFGVPLVVAAWQSIVHLQYFGNPDPAHWSRLSLPGTLADILLVAYFVSGFLLFLQSMLRAELSREKNQAKWILYGVAIGTTPFVILWTVPRLFGMEPWIPFEYARLLTIASPTAFAISVVWYQFMDIDVVIRRSIIYAGLAGVMVFVYWLIGVRLGGVIESAIPRTSEYIAIASVVVPVILFNPTRKMIGRWVDRTFFKIHQDYQQALNALRVRLQDASSHGQVADALLRSLGENLRPKRAAVMVGYQDRLELAGEIEDDLKERAFADYGHWAGPPARLVASPRSTSLSELETPGFPTRFHDAGFLLAQTLPVKEDCNGLILLSQKESERRYVEEDLEFLSTAAAEAARVLDRLCLVQERAEEAMERNRLGEMDRLKNEFLSQVAHDLRTPITSIRWSSRNLIDGLAGEPTREQRDYLDAIDASASHLSRLVNNLLEISRLESGRAHFDLELVDLEGVIESSVTSLLPQARSRQIEFRVETRPGIVPVRANEEKMIEVVNNLLENAVKFAPQQSNIEISIGPEDERQKFVVRDHGPGIPAEEIEAIFERFKQGTVESGSTQEGFGLGLFVVKSFIELMNGQVWAENHPEGGAQFICLLPNWSASEGM
jgi:signal transduction histidine kinase